MNKKIKKTMRQRDSFSILLKILLAVFLLLFLLCVIKTCIDCRNQIYRVITIVDETGYLPDKEDWDIIPDVVPPYDDNDLDSLSESISLEAFFPPIGDQGQYGTCVAWAVGYNLKTALNAIEHHWDSIQLAKPVNQTSPKDLWMSIPANQKGAMCRGTGFGPAFTVMMERGVADMKKVPYRNLGNCQGNILGDTLNRISGFKHIVSNNGAQLTVQQLKAYLHDTIPLVISAKLGYAFMEWNSNLVLNQDNYLMEGADHAYHAMVLVGYDDSKQAFRVRNSWGVNWGDKGSIWIDYSFFMNQFLDEVFMANNH